MKETRFEEIKRCLARAEELGGSSLEPYDLEVRDVRYLVDEILKLRETIADFNELYYRCNT